MFQFVRAAGFLIDVVPDFVDLNQLFHLREVSFDDITLQRHLPKARGRGLALGALPARP